jgi:hypothetical protein
VPFAAENYVNKRAHYALIAFKPGTLGSLIVPGAPPGERRSHSGRKAKRRFLEVSSPAPGWWLDSFKPDNF